MDVFSARGGARAQATEPVWDWGGVEYVYVSRLNQRGPLPPFLGYDPTQNVSLSKYLLSKKNETEP